MRYPYFLNLKKDVLAYLEAGTPATFYELSDRNISIAPPDLLNQFCEELIEEGEIRFVNGKFEAIKETEGDKE